MKKVTKFALLLGSALMCLSTTYAGAPSNNDHLTTFLGPTLRAGFTSPLSDMTAYSLAGEAGLRNFRVGATLGFRFDTNQRLKFSAEYLWQQISYAFFSGNTRQWVNQGAIGADYQYTIWDVALRPQFDLSGWYSHAPSKTLGTTTGTFLQQGLLNSFVDSRHIAGSNAGGVAPGIAIQPWLGGKFGLALNYDDVSYNQNYSPNENARGFGGTARLSQFVSENILISGVAAVRKPFNNYAGSIAWTNVPYYGNWTVGLDGGYTAGKNTLPNTYNVGISIDYFLEPERPNLKGDLKGERSAPGPADDFLAWTADPAVYLPQVLAIPDQQVTRTCALGFPTVTTPIPDVVEGGFFGTPFTIVTATHFTGTGLTYTLSPVTPALTPPGTLTINPTTGLITGALFDGASHSIVVTASNACGTVSNSFTISSVG